MLKDNKSLFLDNFSLKKFFFFIFLSSVFYLSAQVSVNIPSVYANTNETVSVPVSITDLEEAEIFSIYTEISFDPQIIEVAAVITDSCITEDWSEPFFSIRDSSLVIGIFGTETLPDDGNIFNLIFNITTQIDTFSVLQFIDFIFNEGEPETVLSDGVIMITNRTPSISPVDDIFAAEGDLIDFYIIAEDPFDLNLTLTAFDLPDNTEFEDFGDGSGYFQWQTTQISSGDYSIGFTATNEQSFTDTIFVNITVENILNVWMPEIETASTDSIIIPIYTDDVSDLGIFSFYTKISFNHLVLEAEEITTSGTICENWGILTSNLTNPGEIIISMFGTEELTGNGTLLNIDFDIIGDEGSSSELTFDFFIFNDGIPEVTISDGMIFIGTPVADFNSNFLTNGYSPLIIEFYDQSISGPVAITDWEWDFGDGNISDLQNPIHTFYETGSYPISLQVWCEDGATDTKIRSNYIIVLPIEADFTANPTNGYHPAFEVDFTDVSIGNITSWNWDFQNDGIDDSFEPNPSFIYTDAGIYDVKLEISDGTNVDSLIREDYITVLYPPPASPTNVQINISGNDAIVSWAEVDTTIFGAEIEIDFYVIFGSDDPYNDFNFLNTTTDTLYIQNNITLFEDKKFYYVESFIGTRQELDRYLDVRKLNTESTE